MATSKQRTAAKRNIRKAQATWRSMSRTARSRAQPEGRSRRKPGSTGSGDYYHIEARPKREFVAFRTQDVGRFKGHPLDNVPEKDKPTPPQKRAQRANIRKTQAKRAAMTY